MATANELNEEIARLQAQNAELELKISQAAQSGQTNVASALTEQYNTNINAIGGLGNEILDSDTLLTPQQPSDISPAVDPQTGGLEGVTEVRAALAEAEFVDPAMDPTISLPGPEITPLQDADPDSFIAQENSNQANYMLTQAQNQATVAAQRNQSGVGAAQGDWRVRLSLAPSATYFYKSSNPGIMYPLVGTNGVIFPYTPTIAINYSADYQPYDLTHSNYRGYFYKGSKVGEITITADFTAQDTSEADYMLASIHFFRSCTKMFYGQDAERGTPPPLVYLTGLGEYQFNKHPCVISNFAYNLPPDVDYIRARGRQTTTGQIQGDGMLWKRSKSTTAGGFSFSSIWARLTGSAQSVGIGFGSNAANMLLNGAQATTPSPQDLGTRESTYVPTKMTATLTLLPIQSREQVSRQFSLKEFANGNLLKGGYW